MTSSIKTQYSVCTVWMFLIKLCNYEPGIFDLVLDFITTITIKTNEDLQMKIDKFFKNCGEGYKTMGCMSRWNVFGIKQINVVFPRKQCCMNGFKIRNWLCQQEPIITYNSDCCYCKQFSSRLKRSHYSTQPRYIHLCYKKMYTMFVGEFVKIPQLNNKNFKRQRDRITRYANKTSPKIKSGKMQRCKR